MGLFFAPTRLPNPTVALIGSAIIFCFAVNSFAKNNRAIQFTNSAYYSCPMRLDTMPKLTIEVWVRLDSAQQTGWPVSYGSDSSGFGLFLYQNLTPSYPSPIMIASGYKYPSITGNSVLMPLGGWVHIALTKDDTVWMLYRNGMLAGRGKLQLPAMDSVFRIGRFSGAMQQLRIWSFARTVEEIRADVYRIMADTEQGLYASFDIDSGTRDSIRDGVHNFVMRVSGPIGIITNIPGIALLGQQHSPKVSWNMLPAHLQFIPRQKSGYGTIRIAGSVLDSGYDSVLVDRSRNDQVEARIVFPLTYSANSSNFEIIDSIRAEPSQYTYDIYCKRHDSIFYLAESADLVSGDVYVIDGQSNAHFAYGWFYWQVPFLRSFGVQTPNENFDPYDPADTLWGLANCSNWGASYISLTGPYLTGVWGMHLQEDILNNFSIPVCIINGAAGNSSIEDHARSDLNPQSLSTIYGKLLYRVQKAKCQNDVKAILWDQGEFNTATNYYNNFKALYQDWQQDYHLEDNRKTYVLQVRPGCGPAGGSGLREVQRTFPDSLPVEVMSSVATRGHDGCHYSADGYITIGDNIYRLIARDLYSSSDTVGIEAPNIAKAFYSLSDSSEVSLVTRNRDTTLQVTNDTTIDMHSESLKNYFYLDGVSGMISKLSIHRDTIKLNLTEHSKASRLTYLPSQNYNDTALVYEGPWIVNGRGIGMLSFDSIPILAYNESGKSNVAETSAPVSIISYGFHYSPAPVIVFELSSSSLSSITVYDLLGRGIQTNTFFAQAKQQYEMPINRSLCRNGVIYFAILRTMQGSQMVKFSLPYYY